MTSDAFVWGMILGFIVAAVVAFTLAVTTSWSDNAIKVVTSASFVFVTVLVWLAGAR